MRAYLGIGTNIGDKLQNLADSISALNLLPLTKVTDCSNIYETDGLIAHYDAINNTGSGHDSTATVWKDISGNGNDLTLYNFNSPPVGYCKPHTNLIRVVLPAPFLPTKPYIEPFGTFIFNSSKATVLPYAFFKFLVFNIYSIN